MLIATFGPTTAWEGKQITHDGGAFVLEDHGPISAADIMEYDRQGHLVWVNDGTRAWVGSKARRSPSSGSPAANATATPRTSEARGATTGVASQPSPRKRTYLKRVFLVAIALLVVTDVVILLAILGVLRGL